MSSTYVLILLIFVACSAHPPSTENDIRFIERFLKEIQSSVSVMDEAAFVEKYFDPEFKCFVCWHESSGARLAKTRFYKQEVVTDNEHSYVDGVLEATVDEPKKYGISIRFLHHRDGNFIYEEDIEFIIYYYNSTSMLFNIGKSTMDKEFCKQYPETN